MKRIWRDLFAEPGSATRGEALPSRSLARALLVLAVGALCLAALVAIGLLLFGDFGETEGKILLTVLAIAGYSLLGLAVTTALGREPAWLGPVGLVVSAVGFVLCVALIWTTPEGSLLGRLMGAVLVVAVALAHAALLLLVTRRLNRGPVYAVRRATLVVSAALTVMILIPLLSEWEPASIYARLMGAVAVLAVLGTLLAPILLRLTVAPGAPSEGIVGAPESEAAEGARLEFRYKGRTFVVQAVERDVPTPGFVPAAWEVAGAGREPIVGLARQGEHEDRPTALAFAVRQIAGMVDEEAGIARRAEVRSTAAEVMAASGAT